MDETNDSKVWESYPKVLLSVDREDYGALSTHDTCAT